MCSASLSRMACWAFAVAPRSVGTRASTVHRVNNPNLEFWVLGTKDVYRSKCFQRGDVPGAGHDDVGQTVVVVARPIPDADPGRSVLNCGVHSTDKDTGRVMLIGLWEAEAHAAGLAISGSYQEQMAKVASIISGTSSTELYEVSLQV